MKFTGHERDSQLGLDYMLARYYGPSLGRFLSVDPVVKRRKNTRLPQRWNRFTYSLNNPIKYLDPDGRNAVAVTGNDGTTRVIIPVQFTGSGATDASVQAVLDRVNNQQVTGESNISIQVVATDQPIHGVLNTMDMSPGADTTMCGAPGECVNRPGGDKGHINTDNEMSTEASAHDVLHFAGIDDQYVEGAPDENGNRTSTPTPGYTDDNVMTSREGDQLKPEQLQEAVDNPTTRQVTEEK